MRQAGGPGGGFDHPAVPHSSWATYGTSIACDGPCKASTSSCMRPTRSSRCRPVNTTRLRLSLTNVMGARNIIEAAIDRGVKRVLGISTDKAGQPGQPVRRDQAVCRKTVRTQGNAYAGAEGTRLCLRPLRQRHRQSRQRDPRLPRAANHRKNHDHRSANDAVLANARSGRAVRDLGAASNARRRDFRPPRNSQHEHRRPWPTRSPAIAAWNRSASARGRSCNEVLDLRGRSSADSSSASVMFVIQPHHPWWTRQGWYTKVAHAARRLHVQ